MLVEADFLREYGVDLAVDLAGMSWRRFLTLLRGLSPQSATVTSALGRQEFGTPADKVAPVPSDRAQEVFRSLFGRRT